VATGTARDSGLNRPSWRQLRPPEVVAAARAAHNAAERRRRAENPISRERCKELKARSRAARRTSECDYEVLISDDSEDEVGHEQADVPASTSTDDHAPDVSSPPRTDDEDNIEPEDSVLN
jgi:hypothetical protein